MNISLYDRMIGYNKQLKLYSLFINYLKKRVFNDNQLKKLLDEPYLLGCSLEDKSDYYYGYIIFPVFDLTNKVVSFTGRKISDKFNGPKHKHWPGTIDYFYNFKEVISTKKNDIIITESPLNTLSLNVLGFSSIATMGSYRRPNNLEFLYKFNIYILYDIDENNAGFNASYSLADFLYINCNTKNIKICDLYLASHYLSSQKEDEKNLDVNQLFIDKSENEFSNIIRNTLNNNYSIYKPKKLIDITTKKTKQYINEINKEKYDIVSIINSFINLKPKGSLFIHNCPFHNDSDPSFTVYPSTNSWYCFGCNIGGDIFEFIERIMGVSFKEAKEYLEINYG